MIYLRPLYHIRNSNRVKFAGQKKVHNQGQRTHTHTQHTHNTHTTHTQHTRHTHTHTTHTPHIHTTHTPHTHTTHTQHTHKIMMTPVVIVYILETRLMRVSKQSLVVLVTLPSATQATVNHDSKFDSKVSVVQNSKNQVYWNENCNYVSNKVDGISFVRTTDILQR